ncbi:glycosyl transferase [Sporolactobacillus inulinus]|nr:glycosyl transferase [Sporolactobacillus inulinus]
MIIVDDGSIDGTLSILQKYAEKYDFIKVKTQENQKQSAARNNGLKQASGKYILFVDSDDYLEENMLSEMYKTIENDRTDLCICGIKKIFHNRTEVEIRSCLQNSTDCIADYLVHHQEMDVGVWNKLFKKDILIDNNIQFENENFFEDTLFVFKYLCNITHNISFIEKPLYNLIKRENSTTTNYSPDIEIYSGLLIGKIKAYLTKKELESYESYVDVVEIRNLIHIVHHNIKFNRINKKEKINMLLSNISFKMLIKMPSKYKIALLLMKFSPTLYEKFYLRKKNI